MQMMNNRNSKQKHSGNSMAWRRIARGVIHIEPQQLCYCIRPPFYCIPLRNCKRNYSLKMLNWQCHLSWDITPKMCQRSFPCQAACGWLVDVHFAVWSVDCRLAHTPTLMHTYSKILRWGHNPTVASNWSEPKFLQNTLRCFHPFFPGSYRFLPRHAGVWFSYFFIMVRTWQSPLVP